MKKSGSKFVPAQESAWFTFLFDLYARTLFLRRFENVWVDQNYRPAAGSKTIYYLNHNSWWDGLIPLLLNRKLFRQNARAMMEDNQLRKYEFFKKMGAFSINPNNPGMAARSLRYTVESMKRDGSSLFIYPQGEIVPFSTRQLNFRQGIGWIVSRCPDVDVVPVGIYMHCIKSGKPELFLKIGKALSFNLSDDPDKLNRFLETKLSKILTELRHNAHYQKNQFKKI